jgi:WD40 repeat protein
MTDGSRSVLHGHTNWVNDVAIASGGTWLATASHDDRTVRTWDAVTGAHRVTITQGGEGHPLSVMAIAPDGTWLVVASAGGPGAATRVVDAATGRQRFKLSGHGPDRFGFPGVYGAAIAPDGTWFATSGTDGTLRVWDSATGAQRSVLGGHEHKVHGIALAIAPDGTWLASAGVDTVGIWAIGTRTGILGGSKPTSKLSTTLSGHRSQIRSVAIAPDGSWVVTTSRDGTARVWDPSTGRQRASFTGHGGMVNFVSIASDGRWIATTGDDDTVRIWHPSTGAQSASVPAGAGFATQVAISPDSKWFATTTYKNDLSLWDPVTGAELARLTGHTDSVQGVAIAPDGTWLATTSSDHTARIWHSPV